MTASTYEFRVRDAQSGWWYVEWRFGYQRAHWTLVAKVFGEKRAEICRDALLEEANERVCDGSSECQAEVHIHGCFADKGSCDEPEEHRV